MKPSMLRFAIGILIGLHIGKFGCKIYQEQDVFHERRYLVTAMPSIHSIVQIFFEFKLNFFMVKQC